MLLHLKCVTAMLIHLNTTDLYAQLSEEPTSFEVGSKSFFLDISLDRVRVSDRARVSAPARIDCDHAVVVDSDCLGDVFGFVVGDDGGCGHDH